MASTPKSTGSGGRKSGRRRLTRLEARSRRKFVNKVRGSRFPEINLDDLAVELLDSSADRRLSVVRSFKTTPTGSTSRRRGRSMSK
ncbi:hypothetical protein ACFXTO_004254 [Malus domestica]